MISLCSSAFASARTIHSSISPQAGASSASLIAISASACAANAVITRSLSLAQPTESSPDATESLSLIRAAKSGRGTWGESALSSSGDPPPAGDLRGERRKGVAFVGVPASRQGEERCAGVDDVSDDTPLVRVPGCKIMPAEGGVRCPGTFDPPPALREGCSNLGRTGGKGGRALLVPSVTIADLFLSCVGVDVDRTGSDVGTLTNELVFRGSEIFNSSKLS